MYSILTECIVAAVRCGEGRFKSCITSEEGYVLGCYRYIELNPVRAAMVNHPAEYPWSSYRVNAQGEQSTLIVSQSTYQKLGVDMVSRQLAYRELFRQHLDIGLVDQIRIATNGNFTLGSEQFSKQVEHALGRRVTPGKSGRPKRN